jgi:hypothetical protein
VILAAGLLVLLGVGLFVGGVVTGVDAFYWACVLVCIAAAGLLIAARRQISTAASEATSATKAATTTGGATAGVLPERNGGDDAAAAAQRIGEEPPVEELRDPAVEEVEVTDLLLVVDLTDEVFVIDEHPRYHVEGCVHLRRRTPIPLPMDEARTDGFTPCAVCSPDRTMAERVRARRAAGSN